MLTTTEATRLDNSNPELERAGAFTDIRTDLATYTPVYFRYAIAADATTAVTAFTAPFAMVIDRIDLLTTVGEASNTFKVLNGTTDMCTALVATTAKAITSMAAGVETAQTALDAGDVVKVQAAGGSNGANQRGILTFYGHRV